MEPSAENLSTVVSRTEYIIQMVYSGLQVYAESSISNLMSCCSSPPLLFFEQSASRLKVLMLPVLSSWAVTSPVLHNLLTLQVKWKSLSCVRLFVTLWNSPGQNTRVGTLSLLQRNFPTQGLNPGLTHWGRILNQLSHKGSPRILEWVAYPFSRGSSWPRNLTGVSCIANGFFTNGAIKEALTSRAPA